jgi:N-acetylglucosaminyldiphosphoundecaprenol N-acetyl-beta-D-mannosaminyltransferase
MKTRNTISFLGISIDILNTTDLCSRVLEFIENDNKIKVMYVNVDCMIQALSNRAYKSNLNRADLVYADGVGVVLGAKIFGYKLPQRSTGADFFPEFCRTFASRGLRIYLLGSREGVAEIAAENLKDTIPNLQIVGTHHGYFSKQDEDEIIQIINEANPHIVFVGLGAPYQEEWMCENENKIEANIIWGVGGLFDFISCRTRRGPKILFNNGFEWLCRLIVEPRRLWKRYLIGNSIFLFHLILHRFFIRENVHNVN